MALHVFGLLLVVSMPGGKGPILWSENFRDRRRRDEKEVSVSRSSSFADKPFIPVFFK
jgi:hypothetical protein